MRVVVDCTSICSVMVYQWCTLCTSVDFLSLQVCAHLRLFIKGSVSITDAFFTCSFRHFAHFPISALFKHDGNRNHYHYWYAVFQWADERFPTCLGHGKPCSLRTVVKQGPSNGRRFFCCPLRKNTCQFFEWAVGYGWCNPATNFSLLGPACVIHLARSVQLFPAYCYVRVAMYYLLIAHLCM